MRAGRYPILSPRAVLTSLLPAIFRFPVYWAVTTGSAHWGPLGLGPPRMSESARVKVSWKLPPPPPPLGATVILTVSLSLNCPSLTVKIAL